MEAAIMRHAGVISLLFLLAACKGIGLSELDTHGPDTPAGLSHMNSESPDAADDKWLKGFYGNGHGWGWDAPKEDDPNCSFWGTCPK